MAARRPVLEVGGTHVSAALIDPADWSVHAATRLPLDADADADTLLARFAHAAARIAAPADACWGVAMPDPFDYERGVGRFAGVGKFTALYGVEVGAGLLERIAPRPASVEFVNDADAFVLGEWAAGSARGAARCVGITLGTGVGSGWLIDGQIVDPGDPPGGRIHLVQIDGVPLEDTVSRRAIRRAFAAAGGDPQGDVREIADLARSGDPTAQSVLEHAFTALGGVIGRCVHRFGADVLVLGGSMAASWICSKRRSAAARRSSARARCPNSGWPATPTRPRSSAQPRTRAAGSTIASRIQTGAAAGARGHTSRRPA